METNEISRETTDHHLNLKNLKLKWRELSVPCDDWASKP